MRPEDVWGAWEVNGIVPGGPPGRLFIDDHCPNCCVPLGPEIAPLWCSKLCRQMAKHVRYIRRVTRDGRIEDPDVQLAVNQRLGSMSYPAAARQLRPTVRQEVTDRDGGRCVRCGEPGTEIDHIDGSSPELANLQLLCTTCHRAKTEAGMVPASAEHVAFVTELMYGRVAPDVPVLLCDDDAWDAVRRQLKPARRARLLEQLDDLGYRRSDFPGLTWAQMWEEISDEIGLEDLVSGNEAGEAGYGPDSYFVRAMERDD